MSDLSMVNAHVFWDVHMGLARILSLEPTVSPLAMLHDTI